MLTENKLSSGRKTFDRSKWTSLDLEVGENRETSYYEYVGVTVDQDKPEKDLKVWARTLCQKVRGERHSRVRQKELFYIYI